MKRWCFLVIAVAIVAIPLATYGWVRSYGTEGVDAGVQVQQIADGYLVFANTHLDGLSDMWLLKINPEGDTVWTHTFEMSGPEWGDAVFMTPDNGYMVFGSNNYPGVIIIRTDSAGNQLWTRSYDMRLLTSAHPTSDGGYILGQDFGLDGRCSVMKVDDQCDSLWLGVYEFEDTRDVEEIVNQGFIITGGEGRDGTIWLLKVDTAGAPLWSKTYSNWEASYGNCVKQTSDGGYIVAGSCAVEQEGRLLVIKMDSAGDSLWSYVADYESVAKCVCETKDGFLVAGGDSDATTALLVKLSKSGDLLWEHRYGTRTDFNWMDTTTDGGFILTGSIHIRVENDDLYIVKTDEEGNPAVAEQPEPKSINWQITSEIGRDIVLRYTNHPEGFHAVIFDALGRKVDELHSTLPDGVLEWGMNHNPGVYFIRVESGTARQTQKVVLVK